MTRKGSVSSGGSMTELFLGFFNEIDDAGVCRSFGDVTRAGDGEGEDEEEVEDEGYDPAVGRDSESSAFWGTQYQLLQEAMGRSSSTESRVRTAAEAAVRAMRSEAGSVCCCSVGAAIRPPQECRDCAMRYIAQRLHVEAGLHSAVCKSKWSRSPEIPSGEHRYIEVLVDSRSGSKRGPTRVVVEPNFRAEFEMARGSREYKELVSGLPEMFIGKTERLKSVIKIMCTAVKKCARENRMHMAPWRTHRYMQSKWRLGSVTTTESSPTSVLPSPQAFVPAEAALRQMPRKRTSMLTFDLRSPVLVG